MTIDVWVTLAVLILALGLFISEKLPVDVVALLVLATLLVTGVLSPAEAFSGFSSEATITVAAMFVLSAGLQRSGAMLGLGARLARIRWPWLQALLVMAVIGPLSAFVNNTAAVAVFLPLVLAASLASRRPASRILIPLSYAAQMGGVCTLIGTSTNLLVNSMIVDAGLPGFGLFEFSELGLIMLAAGVAYLVLVGPWLLPDRTANEFQELPELGKYLTELRVRPDSALIGKTTTEVGSAEKFGIMVIAVLRGAGSVPMARATPIELGDVLLAQGDWSKLQEFGKRFGLRLEAENHQVNANHGGDAVLVEAMIAPNAHLQARTLAEVDFQGGHRAIVLAIHRRGEVLRDKLREVRLAVGDLLLMAVPPEELPRLRQDANVVVVSTKEQEQISWRRAIVALSIMAAVVLVASQGWLPIVASALVGCIALVLLRGLTPEEAYRAVDWRVVMLLAGLLPLGLAIQKTGLANIVVTQLMPLLGPQGPLALLAVLYLATMVLTEVMSNSAAAVLLTPVALSSAVALGVDPKPFVIAVMFAASTSFATPVGYQTNTMVYNAGGYRFTDFMRIGIPLNLLFWLLAVIFVPRYFPFHP